MVNCNICNNKIGFLKKKIKVGENEFCHDNCWFETKPGKIYALTVNANEAHLHKKYKEALKMADEGLSMQKDNLDLLALKANILGTQGKIEESLDYAKRAHRRFEEIYGKGFIKNQIEKTRSEEISQEWLIKNDHLADMYGDILRALILDYINLKQYEKAIPHLKEEIAIFPTFVRSYDDLAKCYYQLKKIDESKLYFRKALEVEGCPEEILDDLVKKSFSKNIKK